MTDKTEVTEAMLNAGSKVFAAFVLADNFKHATVEDWGNILATTYLAMKPLDPSIKEELHDRIDEAVEAATYACTCQ